ncbi:hypothetical protein J6590_095844, partial [Homalodisca vitripennis]
FSQRVHVILVVPIVIPWEPIKSCKKVLIVSSLNSLCLLSTLMFPCPPIRRADKDYRSHLQD